MNAKQKRSSIFVCGQNNFDQLWAECLFLEVNNIWTSSEWQRKINGHRQNISVNNETAHENEMFTFVSMAYSANDFGTMRTLCRPTWMNNTLEWCEWALLFNNLHRWHRTQTQPKSQTFSFIQHICTHNDSIQRWLAVANRFNGFSMNSTTQIKPNLKIILNQRVDEIAIIDSLWLIEKREEKIHLIASTNGKKECYNHKKYQPPRTIWIGILIEPDSTGSHEKSVCFCSEMDFIFIQRLQHRKQITWSGRSLESSHDQMTWYRIFC